MITSREFARIQVLTPRFRQKIASIRLQTRRIPVKLASIRVNYPEFFTNAQETEYNDRSDVLNANTLDAEKASIRN